MIKFTQQGSLHPSLLLSLDENSQNEHTLSTLKHNYGIKVSKEHIHLPPLASNHFLGARIPNFTLRHSQPLKRHFDRDFIGKVCRHRCHLVVNIMIQGTEQVSKMKASNFLWVAHFSSSSYKSNTLSIRVVQPFYSISRYKLLFFLQTLTKFSQRLLQST